MKAVIVEDEPLSVAELRNGLAEIAPWIEIVATTGSVAGAVTALESVSYDLVFMDINLDDGNSFEIFKRTDVKAPVIFITAYDAYALQAFENKGIDYLLKPFGRDDLRRALDKLGFLGDRTERSPDEVAALPEAGGPYQERFLVNIGTRMKSVATAEVAYFMADGKYLHLFTHGGANFLLDRTLTEVGRKLPPNLFFRINRKFIISFEAIREMVRYSGSRIKVTLAPPPPAGEETLVSTDRMQAFRRWLDR